MNIYISGSISKNPNYMVEFKEAELMLQEKGFKVVNPAENGNDSWTYKRYIDTGMLQLMECDCIYMLKGYEESIGAMLELAYAEAVGIKVIKQEETQMTKDATITISIEEFTRLKDIETRFEIMKQEMLNLSYLPIHHQNIMGIEKEYAQKHEIKTDLFPDSLKKKKDGEQ